ncbi:MAG: hypothetical protein A2103_03475 [Gammaproteobacteria bacterium GWF2_41_13]|nr:MAG: hypothetical protein A2103_03475 [Gammaproteobacteria bacterium GWF2_41_13]
MTQYRYIGRDADGKLVKGKFEAMTENAMAEQLLQQSITPLHIDIIQPSDSTMNPFKRRKVSLEQLITFCRQMYTLIKAGVPIVQSVRHIAETSRSKALTDGLNGVVEGIEGGLTFAQALAKHPKIFPPIFVSIIDAGENSGQLDVSFEQLTRYLELEASTIKTIKTVVRYPILVTVAICTAIIVINFMVVPAFSKLFLSFHSELPLPTRILIGMSNFLTQQWYYLLIIIILLFFIIRHIIHTKLGRLSWDHWKLKIPVIGDIMYRIILARFSRTFALMLKTGLPVRRGLTLSAAIVNNEYISEAILAMRDHVERGVSLTQAARESHLFSSLVIQMISVGETAGSIDTLLTEVAEYYEREVAYDLTRLTDLIEPVLLVIMGSMVLLLALGVFLPMWDMVQFTKFKAGG